ncbi:MAG: sigma-70 family RNA polymerase sigma factor [Planctomycetales bacterium]|nr:sigma-70 family RNA polymerase sigma factor [Planctomycetales bacterium]
MSTSKQIDETRPNPAAAERLHQSSDGELLDAWTRDRLSVAFAILVERYGRMVLAVCRRKCCSASDADDAYQTTFLLLAKNSAKISRPECLAGWLHRVAQRASIATITRRTQSSDEAIDQAMDDDPLDRITQQHDAIVLDEELASLPEHYRAALVMHVYQDYALERMAEHFQTTLGSIRGRLQRGKKMLAGRLRRRGVVPVMAVAAAGATAVTAGDVSAANASLFQALGTGATPTPPIPENLLNPLFNTGRRIMTPWNAIGGVAAAGTIAAILMTPGFGSDDGGRSGVSDRTMPVTIEADQEPVVAQFFSPVAAAQTNPTVVANVAAGESDAKDQTTASGSGMMDDAGAGSMESSGTPMVGGGFGGGGLPVRNAANGDGTTVLRRSFRAVTPTGPLAESLKQKMDEPVEIQLDGTVGTLFAELESQLDVPVMLGDRVIEYAKLDLTTPLKYQGRSEPLRTALRKILKPLGLKASIESDGLVLTADHSELVHHGIGTDRWLNVNDEMMRKADDKLSQPITLTLVEATLSDAVRELSDQLELPIMIDHRALEEFGIDSDVPVSVDLKGVAAYDLMAIMFDEHELALGFHNNILTVTSLEVAEDRLLTRIYWLEGIGLGGDFQSLLNLIEATVVPDTWESLGGSSTMSPVPGKRPGLVINSTYDVHRQVEQLIKALRENSFALDAVAEDVEVPAPNPSTGGFGGGGFSGGFGGGMGGMGGMGGGFM